MGTWVQTSLSVSFHLFLLTRSQSCERHQAADWIESLSSSPSALLPSWCYQRLTVTPYIWTPGFCTIILSQQLQVRRNKRVENSARLCKLRRFAPDWLSDWPLTFMWLMTTLDQKSTDVVKHHKASLYQLFIITSDRVSPKLVQMETCESVQSPLTQRIHTSGLV